MTKQRYDQLSDQFASLIDRRVKYETTHEDVGDAHSHLAREGGWDHGNGLDRLKEWMSENKIDVPNSFDWKSFEDEVLDWHEMEPGHIFSGGSDSSRFVIDSYLVGEIEIQHEVVDVADALEISDAEADVFLDMAMDDNRFCLRDNYGDGVFSYVDTDSVWIACVSKDWILERIDWAREELAQD
jgi:hypothetical protein